MAWQQSFAFLALHGNELNITPLPTLCHQEVFPMSAKDTSMTTPCHCDGHEYVLTYTTTLFQKRSNDVQNLVACLCKPKVGHNFEAQKKQRRDKSRTREHVSGTTSVYVACSICHKLRYRAEDVPQTTIHQGLHLHTFEHVQISVKLFLHSQISSTQIHFSSVSTDLGCSILQF